MQVSMTAYHIYRNLTKINHQSIHITKDTETKVQGVIVEMLKATQHLVDDREVLVRELNKDIGIRSLDESNCEEHVVYLMYLYMFKVMINFVLSHGCVKRNGVDVCEDVCKRLLEINETLIPQFE